MRLWPSLGCLANSETGELSTVGSDPPTADAVPQPGRPCGILARPIHEPDLNAPRPAGLDGTTVGNASDATDVELYGESDCREEMRLELLVRPEPASGLRQSARIAE
jgi:hypothetical protein